MTDQFPATLQRINETVFLPNRLFIQNYSPNDESAEYDASYVTINEMNIQFRLAKITPAKTGQFVTIWKRNEQGKTVPFEIEDNLHFIIIAAIKGDETGLFIFPMSVLADKRIISRNGKEGKRGIRVYPPWDKTVSDQAKKTQSWQKNYFLEIETTKGIQPDRLKQLFEKLQ